MKGLFGAVYLVLLVVLLSCFHESEGLKCYSCTGDCSSSGFNSDQNSIVEGCGGTCTKIIDNGVVTRGCSASYDGGSACDSAPTITVCYCNEDLCNTATTYGVTFTLVTTSAGLLLRSFF